MAKKYQRIFVIVLDSLGIGSMEDAAEFGDEGADTMGHIAEQTKGLAIPNLQRLGLANLRPLAGISPAEQPEAYFMAFIPQVIASACIVYNIRIGLVSVNPELDLSLNTA